MVKNRAPVAVGMIARNAEKTLGRCLDSIRPYVTQIVVGVDETTTDKTAKVAKKHGATVVPVKVSDYHECPHHGRVLAQHFADARNQVFSHLDKSLPFLLWIDADDVLEGGERLAELCAAVPGDAAGVWFPYVYAHHTASDGTRVPNTVFHRERLLKTSIDGQPVKWTWKHRVHEVVTPELVGTPKWIFNHDIKVVHQDGGHKTEASAPRNLLLLEIDHESDPDDPRTVFYLGNTYFALGRWDAAAGFYERRVAMEDPAKANPYEVWQSALYACKAYQRLGSHEDALRMAFAALDAAPQHREPYFALAECYAMTGSDGKVEFWTKQGRSQGLQNLPPFVFSNPMDTSYNHHLPIADAHLRQGRITAAVAELEAAHQAFPDKRVGDAIAEHKRTLADMEAANAFVTTARNLDPDSVLGLYEHLPADVRRFGRTRDVVIPLLLKKRDADYAA